MSREVTCNRRAVEHALLLAFGVALALNLMHADHLGGPAASTAGLAASWLRDGVLAMPLALLLARAAAEVSQRLLRWSGADQDGALDALAWALPAATFLALSMLPLTWLHQVVFPMVDPLRSAGPSHLRHLGTGHLSADHISTGAMALGNGAAALLVGVVLVGAYRMAVPDMRRRVRSMRRGSTRRRLVAVAVVPAMAAAMLTVPVAAVAPASGAFSAAPGCNAANQDRFYDVAAINVHIAYNRWGVGNEDAQIYVLQSDKAAVRDWHQPLDTTGSNRRLRPRPLVIRANEGECVAVRFTNELDVTQGEQLPDNPRASMFIRGVPFDVQVSGGSQVGYNDDTTVAIGESMTYFWQAPEEGMYFFNDDATPAGSEADGGSLSAGLYGSFVVEPAGSTWRDPVSGDLLYAETVDQSGELYINAVIAPPNGHQFRESVQLAQDELPHTSEFGFNYGSEPGHQREARACPDCVGEETALSSWTYGDPSLVKLASGLGPWQPGTPEGDESCGLGTAGFNTDSCFTSNVTHAYRGDPIKFRFGMAGAKETHVFHMHAHQWLAEDEDVGHAGHNPTTPGPDAKSESPTIDSQTFGPMEMFTADLLFGAGSKNGTVGDAIFHCHLYPHFAAGFWSLFRTHDVYEDGSGSTPDGIKVAELKHLGDLPAPPDPTADNPGYPRFIPGQAGWRAPQPPLAITRDGAPEPRYVAGQVLDESSPEAQLERSVMDRMSGGRSLPGSPFNNPCPQGAREVTYNVSSIQLKTVYNERGDFDSQGRILVLDRDVDAVLSGRKAPEPLFARVNAGDCVTWNLTNRLPNWFGNDAFVRLQQTNMFGQHIHLVKFDVMASDGSSNGWNYQQAAFSADQGDFNEQMASNPGSCTQTKCRLDVPADFDPNTTSDMIAPGQTITERWYADYELRTVFTHDHHFPAVDQNRGQYGGLVVEPGGMDFRNPVTGAWYQPVNDPAHGAVCGTSCPAGASGASMDVIGPGADDDFREFGLAIADFVSLTRGGGDPRDPNDAINPPLAPEAYPDEDPGVMAVNYRNAPLELRQTKNGLPVDPAYAFSSHVFGDPATPVLQTYTGDNVRIRLIQGSQEEQHVVIVHGVKWQREPDDPQADYIDAQPVGVSEAFNFEVPRLGCAGDQDCRGDYLYSSTSSDDMWTGMWGILRVNGGRVPHLLPLPDNPQTRTGTVPSKSDTALQAPPRAGPGNPCPVGSPTRSFDVVAMQTDITYNKAGDHDPFGLIYTLSKDEAAIRSGQNPEPLVMRAREGDCIEVTLHNKLTPALQQHRGEGDAELPAQSPGASQVPGLRVSLHAGGLLKYDVRGSDGATIGFNGDQSVAPGRSILYRWHADQVTPGEVGAVNLSDYGDVLGHRHHGLFAGLVVEPTNATWHDQVTGAPTESGGAADIRVPGARDFRENIVFFQDGLNLRRADGSIIEDPSGHPPVPGEPVEPVEPVEGLDPEDQGEKAFSYRNEPFRNRLGYEPFDSLSPSATDLAGVYDSHQHGDPATPIFRAYEGDPLEVRVLMGNDKPRQHAFGLQGHSFKVSSHDPGSREVGTRSGLGVGAAVNADMGDTNTRGDYLYGCAVAFFHRSGGLWGMLRVYPAPVASDALRPSVLGDVDDPRAGGHPLLPLELDQVVATAFRDGDGDGVRDPSENPVAGVDVSLSTGGPAAVTGADGVAYLSVRAGTHTVSVTAPEGLQVTKAPARVTTSGDNDARTIAVALRGIGEVPAKTATVRATTFDDVDRDRVRDRNEPAVRGVRVSLAQGSTRKATSVSDTAGRATMRVPQGSYALAVVVPRGYRLLRAPRSVTTGRPGTVTDVSVALAQRPPPRATIRAHVFLDRDRDGVRDRREPVVGRVVVTARTRGVVVSATSTRSGVAVLLLPGQRSYRLTIRPPQRFVAARAAQRVRAGPPASVRGVNIAVLRR